VTFLNLNLGSPVVRAADTVTGELEVVGARFSWMAARRRAVLGGPNESWTLGFATVTTNSKP